MSEPSLSRLFRQRIEDSVSAKRALLSPEVLGTMTDISNSVIAALSRGNKVLLFGNGGSAGDAQHLAAELVGRYLCERRSLPAIALADNPSSLTAIGNDYAYAEVFARQVEGLGSPGDVAIGLSTSGRSENVVRAIEVANAQGLTTVGFTGKGGGRLIDVCDHCVCVPSDETPRIQECHMLLGHTMCEAIEREVAGERHAPLFEAPAG
jgi:D-sedoheptulose 7-phosphate isomerase